MALLSHRDFDAVLRILPELYANRRPVEFFESSIRLVQKLIGFDYGQWLAYQDVANNSCNGKDRSHRFRKVIAVAESEPRVAANIVVGFEQSASCDRFHDYWAGSRNPAVLMSSDFSGAASTSSRCLELDYIMGVPISLAPHAIVRLGVGRSLSPFTERDRQAMNLLQPHLQRAYANTQLLSSALDQAPRNDLYSNQGLTARESEIAWWLAQGKTNAEIGLIVGIARRTVEKHIEHVLKKFHVENRTTAAVHIRHVIRAHKEAAKPPAASPPAGVPHKSSENDK